MTERDTCTVRAAFSETTVRVYQAYSAAIATPALRAGRFVAPFKMERMTWVKPSFHWMMYRSGFGTKPGQEVVLGIDIRREGFEWALANATLSGFKPEIHGTYESWRRELQLRPVRIQWDPERDWRLRSIPGVRAIQIGLTGEAVGLFVDRWIVHLEDVTPLARLAAAAAERSEPPTHAPNYSERPYPLDSAIAERIGELGSSGAGAPEDSRA